MTTTRDEPATSSVFLYGAGRVGTAVAELLRRNEHELVGVASRTTSSEHTAAGFLGCPVVSPEEGASAASLVLLGLPDERITQGADRVAASVTPGTVVCHFAGSFGVDALRSVREAGARPAALHPVQACPDVTTAIQRLPGSAWGVTCDEDLKEWAEHLVTASLAGVPVVIDEAFRPLWHAAAVTTSNGIAALLALAEELLSSIGVETPDAVLGPLAEGTLANSRASAGRGASLTGPIARGESSTVARHIAALRSRAPQLVDPYMTISRMILSAASRAGHLEHNDEAELRSLLDTS